MKDDVISKIVKKGIQSSFRRMQNTRCSQTR